MTRLYDSLFVRLLFMCSMVFAVSLVALGCSVEFPEGEYHCNDDSDCQGGLTCQDQVCRVVSNTDQCVDVDGDGAFFGQCPGIPADELDCDDSDRGRSPTVIETCDGLDNNCNDEIDDGLSAQACLLQVGVCAGSTRECVDGALQDCAAEGLYGALFEEGTELTCDGLDNNCNNEADEECECEPGVTPPVSCGQDAGECERGVTFCLDSGFFGDCVLAVMGADCTSDADCDGDSNFCIEELVKPFHDFEDDCLPADGDCVRNVCRELSGTTACTSNADCVSGEACVLDFCQVVAAAESTEECDWLDNDCDGSVDEGSTTCGTCPAGMLFLDPTPGNPLGTCIDQFEASRPDATADDAGTFGFYAVPQDGVLPWLGLNDDDAESVCRGELFDEQVNAGLSITTRRLCTATELATICADDASCTVPADAGDVAPTGDVALCCVDVAGADACDVRGNAAEWVTTPVTGVFGVDSCSDSAADIITEADGDFPSDEVIGFRCCGIPAQ